MVEWHHPNCPDGGEWEKAGWWQMEPGEERTAYGGSVGGIQASWYYYAHAADGAELARLVHGDGSTRAFDWSRTPPARTRARSACASWTQPLTTTA